MQTTARPGDFAAAPRPAWRSFLRRILALDALFRERADMSALDDRMLRDIGVTRAEIRAALSRPDEHLRLVLLRHSH